MRMRGGSPGGQGGFLVSAYASYVFLFLIEGLSDLWSHCFHVADWCDFSFSFSHHSFERKKLARVRTKTFFAGSDIRGRTHIRISLVFICFLDRLGFVFTSRFHRRCSLQFRAHFGELRLARSSPALSDAVSWLGLFHLVRMVTYLQLR